MSEPRIAPQLSVRRGRAAIAFYTAGFGAVEAYRVGGTDDHPDVVAQLAVGGATFWVADESPEHGNFSPESLGGATTRMLLVVDDPQAVVARAIAAGAAEVHPVQDEHGWRLGRVVDPFGHHWEVGGRSRRGRTTRPRLTPPGRRSPSRRSRPSPGSAGSPSS